MKTLSTKEKWLCAFVAVVMVICLVPLAGMLVAPTTHTTENKVLASMPELKDENGFNSDYLSGLGAYYADHFALRQQLVSLDSSIRSRIFGVSTVDSVVVGRDGWLFYSDTVKDFTGSAPMSDRQLFNIANNMAITQRYVNERGAKFLFTIAPNKNTLYPQFMPYTMQAAEPATHNAVRLESELSQAGVSYSDLFELFGAQDEILYLARDSHWNNDGALLAAQKLLSDTGKADAASALGHLERTVDPSYIGDLNRMLYPTNSKPENNAEYTAENYEITNGARAADDPIIITSASDVSGSLLMYRDSFGNTLYPFMAQVYSTACFVRTVPYNLGLYMDIHQPDTVMIEKVERSIDELASMPPVLETSQTQLLVASTIETGSVITVCEPAENVMLWRIDGTVEPGVMDERSRIFIRITNEDGTSFVREAFTVSDDSTDNGLRMYISKDAVYGVSTVEAIVSVSGQLTSAGSVTVHWDSIAPAFSE